MLILVWGRKGLMVDSAKRLTEAQKQIKIACGAIADDEHIKDLREARQLIEEVRAHQANRDE